MKLPRNALSLRGMVGALVGRDPRRAEAADLLRSRREGLSAESAGLPQRARRRTPGLRREEVAELAGISVALYTWLEQGRDVPVSHKALDAVATALQLTPGERASLHSLISRESVDLREDVTPALRRFVEALRGPTFVLDRGWDVVLRNAEAAAVFGGSRELEERSNLLVEVFTEPACASLFVEYERVAENVVAMFRLDYAARIDDPRTHEVIARLRASVPAFATAWDEHRVRDHPEEVREIVHPAAGSLKLVPSIYGVGESPGLRMLVFNAADPVTAKRVVRLTEAFHAAAEPISRSAKSAAAYA
jgi:transcriptional regulator with XRE-family HTH domain